MRAARIKMDGATAVYHCSSRVVGGQMLLDDLAKETLVVMLTKLAAFCGVDIITYCMMSNHIDVLLRLRAQRELSSAELLERLEAFYGHDGILTVRVRESIEELGHIDPKIHNTLNGRMGNLSVFMKEFKQRFGRWFGFYTQPSSSLWAERFQSVLTEDSPMALRSAAASIDLISVEAGLVDDPKDYRFCGYSAAHGGVATIRQALMGVLEKQDWPQAEAEYRKILFSADRKKKGPVLGDDPKPMIEAFTDAHRSELHPQTTT